ncbi:hypothetical protein [Pseudomonas aeruginosa]|uniref:hypothetical protein n=1 Tax=Pseudomonas aeruginosa TaxID=287 RepID=UPI002E2D6267|nr:hypothetical protein [Pseudomonas aeruginosa]
MNNSEIIQVAIATQPKSASFHLDYLYRTVHDGMIESINVLIANSKISNEAKLLAQDSFLSIFEQSRNDIKAFESKPFEEKLEEFNLAHLMHVKNSFDDSESSITGMIASSKFLISLNEQARFSKLPVNANLTEYIALTDKCREGFKTKYQKEIQKIFSLTNVVQEKKENNKKMRFTND